MLLHLSTWQEVDRYLEASPGIVIPTGSTEQHGPTGLIGTDAMTSEAIAGRVGELCDALVAPPFNVGRAEHHMAFSGTITLRAEVMIEVLLDWATSLSRHGFSRLFFINGHGGNIPVFKKLAARLDEQPLTAKGGGSLRLSFNNWWEGPQTAALAGELYGDAEGSHATPSEVAVTQYLHPGAIKTVPLDPEIAPTGPIRDAADYRRRFPDGRIGSNPALATPQAGGRLLQAAARDLAERYRRFIAA